MIQSTKKKSKASRRKFVKSLVISTTAFTIIPRHVLGGTGFIAPSDKVNIGVVGVGGRGKQNVAELLKLADVQVTSIADPAEYWDLAKFYYNTEAGRGPVKKFVEDHYSTTTPNFKVSVYSDFRKMLENEQALDAILCGTPDHNHAYVSLLSMNADKHVYCEKPLTHNIWEARQVQKIAREKELATQMGNQLHSTDALRQCVEYLRTGALGEVKEVHAWVPATRRIIELTGALKGKSPVPEGLDWDLWLGPSAMRDFHEEYAPVNWRDFWYFGCGTMGDFGCHDMDAAVWGLDLPLPESVELFPAGYSDQDIAPYGELGYYHFPASENREALNLTWYSGGLRPPHPELLPAGQDLPRRGALYVGEKGIMIYQVGQTPKLFPESLNRELNLSPTLEPTNGHHRDWINAIKGGPAASSNFEYGAHLTEIALLGVLSLRMGGKKIYWDAVNMKARGLAEADQLIRESVREGWEMG